MEADVIVRTWLADVIGRRSDVMAIAMRQRAKFEGWLKFELAAHAQSKGASEVAVEAATDETSASRGDLTFLYNGQRCHIELKTCNTNWRMNGVLAKTRPITKNIAGIIEDATKLQNCGLGVVAACLFPVECGDQRWTEYLARISGATGVELSPERNATRVSIPIGQNCTADVVILSFLASKPALASTAMGIG